MLLLDGGPPDTAAKAVCILAVLLAEQRQRAPQQCVDSGSMPAECALLSPKSVPLLGAAFRQEGVMAAAEAERPGVVQQVDLT